MNIIISNSSGKPIYEQIYEQIAAQIVTRRLPAGSVLPAIRTIAAELEISVITIKKAWEELEHMGLINTVTGKGCFVAEFDEERLGRIKEELARKKFCESAGFYRSLGYTADELAKKVAEWFC